MDVQVMTIPDWGYRELEEAADLLKKYVNNPSPPDFDDDCAMSIGFNPYSGYVFIMNEMGDTLIIDGEDNLVSFYSTPYNGIEGTLEELLDNYLNDESDWVEDDIDFLIDILKNNDKDDIAERIEEAEGRK